MGAVWGPTPPVSVPRAAGKKPAATATPDPLEEPPEKWSRCQAFRAGGQGKSKDGPPMANSWVASLPTKTPPAACSRCVTTASVRARLSARILECAVVGTPAGAGHHLGLRLPGLPQGDIGRLAQKGVIVGVVRINAPQERLEIF